MTTVVPSASTAAWVISRSVMSITSVQSPNAWYSSIIVNSGLWRVEMPSLRKIRPISNTRSMPPTISRLRCSSSAIRRYRSIVERVVVGDERAGMGAARLDVQHRRLDLDEALVVQRAAEAGDDGVPDLEVAARLAR